MGNVMLWGNVAIPCLLKYGPHNSYIPKIVDSTDKNEKFSAGTLGACFFCLWSKYKNWPFWVWLWDKILVFLPVHLYKPIPGCQSAVIIPAMSNFT